MTALYIILGLLAAFIVITLIRAAFFTAPKPQREEFPPEQVNGQRACDRLSQAIQIKTISCEDESQTDWGAFDRFHAFLEQSYPLIHKNLNWIIFPPPVCCFTGRGRIQTWTLLPFWPIRMWCPSARAPRGTGNTRPLTA